MKARILDRKDVLKITDLLRDLGYEVVAPFSGRERDTIFDVVTDENRERIQLHSPNPYYPPKRYVFPNMERLLKVCGSNGDIEIEPTYESRKVAIFGIRSCDVAGIYHMDRFYLGGNYPDIYYAKRRENLFLVNMVCTQPDVDIGNDCFCVCTDTGPAARENFDLQLMDLGDEFMAVAGSAAGESLFDFYIFNQGDQSHTDRRRAILNEARRQFKISTSWFSSSIHYISSGDVIEKTWQEIGSRCLECGGCTYVCPACSCFTVTDRKVGPDEFERIRTWDACTLSGFTRMAGGHNPRKAVHDRSNRRFFHKLAQHFIQREHSFGCVGCGRCVSVCHGEIGMPSVVEMIRRATAEINKHELASH